MVFKRLPNGYEHKEEVAVMMAKNNEQKPKKTACNEAKDEATLRKEFIEMVESKIKRSEKDIWFVKNHDRLNM